MQLCSKQAQVVTDPKRAVRLVKNVGYSGICAGSMMASSRDFKDHRPHIQPHNLYSCITVLHCMSRHAVHHLALVQSVNAASQQ